MWKSNGAETMEFCRSAECNGKLTIHLVYVRHSPLKALECSECKKFTPIN